MKPLFRFTSFIFLMIFFFTLKASKAQTSIETPSSSAVSRTPIPKPVKTQIPSRVPKKKVSLSTPQTTTTPSYNFSATYRTPTFIKGKIILILKEGLSDEEEDALVKRLISGIGVIEKARHWSDANFYEIKIVNGMTNDEVIRTLKKNPHVKKVGSDASLANFNFE